MDYALMRAMHLMLAAVCAAGIGTQDGYPDNYVAGSLIRLNDNGAWSWFMDPRAIVDGGKVIVGSVRAVGANAANVSDPRWGTVEVSVYDLAAGTVNSTVLHPHLHQDDHAAPAFFVRKDGRYLALYSKHALERRMYYRISEPGNPLAWGPAKMLQTPGSDAAFAGDNVTYANPFRMPDGRLFVFFRAFSHDPNYMVSSDDGDTWKYGGRWLYGRDGYAPYVKYAQDSKGTVHFVTTEDHPRNFDNSLYHGYLRDNMLYHSDGRPVGPLNTNTDAKIATWDFTKVFQGDPDNVAWMVDIKTDAADHPYVVFSVQKDGRGLPRGKGGFDHRFHYARWNGTAWTTEEIAYAGTRLYAGEDDYTGLAALDPSDPDVIYISTDADPVSGAPLISHADGKRHRELFRGRRSRAGKWSWTPITRNSTADNLRPVVPKSPDRRTVLLWMRGRYVANQGEWYSSIVGLVLPPS